MDIREFFSNEYIVLYVSGLTYQLRDMPKFGIVNRKCIDGTIKSIREYDPRTKKVKCECYLSSEKGQAMLDSKKRREQLEERLNFYKMLWYKRTARDIRLLSDVELRTIYSVSKKFKDLTFYQALEAEAAVRRYGMEKHTRQYNGIAMRSKLETIVATTLGELDLPFKYEAAVKLGNDVKYTDFWVPLIFLNCCFPIEVAGMIADGAYLAKMNIDLVRYFENGFLFNHNLLIVMETDGFEGSSETIGQTICDFVNRIVHDVFVTAEISLRNSNEFTT